VSYFSPNLVTYFQKCLFSIFFILSIPSFARRQNIDESERQGTTNLKQLASLLEVGDAVFIHVPVLLFKKISSTTASWTNHVGIVVDVSGKEPIIGESRVPFSGTTTLSRFVGRSDAGRVEVRRLNAALTVQQKKDVLLAAKKRSWIFYDTGFNLHSNRQFCSRYVREILEDATGISVGEVENFKTLLKNNPNTDLKFWKLWYFGNIPWERVTVSPGSLQQSEEMHTLFDGNV
jgi:Permuted papain-like amidase enzyme, YaeF/YiiX, C92 family